MESICSCPDTLVLCNRPPISQRVNPFRAAVPFWGQTSHISSSLSPKRDCGSKGVSKMLPDSVLTQRKKKQQLSLSGNNKC